MPSPPRCSTARRRARRGVAPTVWIAGLSALAGCGAEPTLDPPDVRWGQDVCSACGMILSEDRYAAAAVNILDGERRLLLFDDLGEVIGHPLFARGDSKLWMNDAATGRWTEATSMWFVRSPAIHTPMGRGIAAFAVETDAQAKQAETGGELLRFDRLSTSPTPASDDSHHDHAHH